MITPKENCKQLIDFLVNRWLLISGLAAIERVYLASCQFAQNNNQPMPAKPPIIEAQPNRQIEIIKQHIISILPEAQFIDYIYEAQAPLDPNDFIEVYLADHQQCADKIRALMQRMKVT